MSEYDERDKVEDVGEEDGFGNGKGERMRMTYRPQQRPPLPPPRIDTGSAVICSVERYYNCE
jgi:hypothetical protein